MCVLVEGVLQKQKANQPASHLISQPARQSDGTGRSTTPSAEVVNEKKRKKKKSIQTEGGKRQIGLLTIGLVLKRQV